MAITSFGYGVDSSNTVGEIGVIQWAAMATYLGAQYSVGEGGLTATIPATGDRVVNIEPGEAFSHGVLSISDAVEQVAFAEPTSGTRYYILGMEFDWAAEPPATTIKELTYGTTIAGALALLTTTPGVLVQMPLYAARVQQGDARVQDLIDLRVWGSGSNLTARSSEVLNFANRPGTTITIGSTEYRRVSLSSGMAWQSYRMDQLAPSRLNAPAEIVGGGGWGTSSSGWTTNSGTSSRLLSWGRWRQILLYSRRSGADLTMSIYGALVDEEVFVIDSGHRPAEATFVHAEYRHGSGVGTVGGSALIQPNGRVILVSGTPNTIISRRNLSAGHSLVLSGTYLT